ncbi:MAG: hypothetical protein V4474_02155 [Patescibacteria group bacterium]
MALNRYHHQLRALLSPTEAQLLSKLRTPVLIQDYLDHFPQNFGPAGDLPRGKAGPHIKSPRFMLKSKSAHCIEGAIFAASALAYHGRTPWLMDIQSRDYDFDHVVALFKENGLWGAISKTNHSQLRWRDPVYRTVRELAMSYYHEYFWPDAGKRMGEKTMRAYSRPFNLTKYPAGLVWADPKGLDWLAEALDDSPHSPAVPRVAEKFLRKATKIEIISAA